MGGCSSICCSCCCQCCCHHCHCCCSQSAPAAAAAPTGVVHMPALCVCACLPFPPFICPCAPLYLCLLLPSFLLVHTRLVVCLVLLVPTTSFGLRSCSFGLICAGPHNLITLARASFMLICHGHCCWCWLGFATGMGKPTVFPKWVSRGTNMVIDFVAYHDPYPWLQVFHWLIIAR
jgi:hypothetical protein